MPSDCPRRTAVRRRGGAAASMAARPRIALLSNPQVDRQSRAAAAHPRILRRAPRHLPLRGRARQPDRRGDADRSPGSGPKVLAINGGDGTVQAALTELHNGGHFGDEPPPVAVLPSGKTNLIALDLGAHGDPIEALERLIALAQGDLAPLHRRARADRASPRRRWRGPAGDRHVPRRRRPCRHDALLPRQDLSARACPTASPTCITAFALLAKLLLRVKASFLPPDPQAARAFRCASRRAAHRPLLAARGDDAREAAAVERARRHGAQGVAQAARGRGAAGLAHPRLRGEPRRQARPVASVRGVHFEEADEITIEGDSSNVILDGETFRAETGQPIHLRPRSRCRSSSCGLSRPSDDRACASSSPRN